MRKLLKVVYLDNCTLDSCKQRLYINKMGFSISVVGYTIYQDVI